MPAQNARCSPSRRHVAALAAAVERHRGPDDPQLPGLRRDLRAAALAEHIRKVVDTAPPLTAEQIEGLRGLLPYPYPCVPAAGREATPA